MRSSLFLLALFSLALPAAAAQASIGCGTPGVNIKFTPPNPAVGEKVTVTIENQSPQKIQLLNSCVFKSVHLDDCGGPVVFAPACLPALTPIAPGESHSTDWDPGVGPGVIPGAGTFAFSVSYIDGLGNPVKCCPTLKVSGGGGPPSCGSFQIYGSGCPGSAGVPPKLGGNGCPAAGGDIVFASAGGAPSAPGILAIGLGTELLPLYPGCSAEIAPWLGALIPINYSPAGTFDLPVTLPSNFPQIVLSMQAVSIDVNFPPSLVVISNGLLMKSM